MTFLNVMVETRQGSPSSREAISVSLPLCHILEEKMSRVEISLDSA